MSQTIDTGQYINGKWVPGTPDEVSDPNFEIQTSLQPISGEDLEILPEGMRTKKGYTLYPNTELRTVDQSNNIEADKVVINDEDYLVIKIFPWQNNLINHYKCLVIREKE